MKYKAFIKQDDGGKIIDLSASTLFSAGREVFGIIKDNHLHDEKRIVSAEVFEISQIAELDCEGICSGKYDEGEAMRLKAQERTEREEYERLKKKFGGQ